MVTVGSTGSSADHWPPRSPEVDNDCSLAYTYLKNSLQYFQSPSVQVSHRSNPSQTAWVLVSPFWFGVNRTFFNFEHMSRSYAEGDSTLRAASRVRLCVDASGWGGKEWGWDSMSRTRPLWPSPSLGSRKQIKHHNISVNHKAQIRNQHHCWFWQKVAQRIGLKKKVLFYPSATDTLTIGALT